MKLTKEQQIEMLTQMCKIRAFEEKADELFAQGKVHGTMHISIGQEATAVGAIAALAPSDYILSTHRGHGHCIAKGADLGRMMAELLGKETGYCRGRGGSMHIADIEGGNLGANGVVAGGIPIAVGVGLSIQMRRSNQVILCFFGDGAANQGAFHESLNMAAIWKLPLVYLCENNQYGMSMAVERAMPIENIADRAAAYAMPGQVVDGNDVLAVYEVASNAVQRARSGQGPTLIEAKTYRLEGHYKGDQERYRTKEEIETWKAKCPIRRLQAHLIAKGILTEKQAEAIMEEARHQVDEAVAFAEASPEPSVATILEGVYA
jgi:pyruvate dehydrogenase E1 component alpha subunit